MRIARHHHKSPVCWARQQNDTRAVDKVETMQPAKSRRWPLVILRMNSQLLCAHTEHTAFRNESGSARLAEVATVDDAQAGGCCKLGPVGCAAATASAACEAQSQQIAFSPELGRS